MNDKICLPVIPEKIYGKENCSLLLTDGNIGVQGVQTR